MSVEPPVPRSKGTPAVSLYVIKKRADFLRAARGHRVPAGSFLLQACNRRDEDEALRVGYTCSKKVGNAVARNRAKRRLREAARLVLPQNGVPGWDYVLIGRANQTASRDFQDLLADLRRALTKVHGK